MSTDTLLIGDTYPPLDTSHNPVALCSHTLGHTHETNPGGWHFQEVFRFCACNTKSGSGLVSMGITVELYACVDSRCNLDNQPENFCTMAYVNPRLRFRFHTCCFYGERDTLGGVPIVHCLVIRTFHHDSRLLWSCSLKCTEQDHIIIDCI